MSKVCLMALMLIVLMFSQNAYSKVAIWECSAGEDGVLTVSYDENHPSFRTGYSMHITSKLCKLLGLDRDDKDNCPFFADVEVFKKGKEVNGPMPVESGKILEYLLNSNHLVRTTSKRPQALKEAVDIALLHSDKSGMRVHSIITYDSSLRNPNPRHNKLWKEYLFEESECTLFK